MSRTPTGRRSQRDSGGEARGRPVRNGQAAWRSGVRGGDGGRPRPPPSRRDVRDDRIEERRAERGDANAPEGARSRNPSPIRLSSRSPASERPLRAAKRRGIDALGEPQAHEQEFVALLLRAQGLVLDEARPSASTRASQASGRRSQACASRPARRHEPAVRAGADAGIFAVAPIDEVVAALAAGAGVVRDFVGRQAARCRHLPRRLEEGEAGVLVGNASLPASCRRSKAVSGSMVSW